MEIINLVKVKDGLFLGNKMTGTTLEVISQFKISNIINASGKQIHNDFQYMGVKYLTFNWVENPSSNINFIKDDTAKKILYFVDNAIKNGEAVLITSVKGQNRAGAVALIYLMKKYNWSFKKALKYYCTKKSYFSLNKAYTYQLSVLENIISKKVKLSNDNEWLSTANSKDELLLCNTFLNEVEIPKKKIKNDENNSNNNPDNNSSKLKRVGWSDRKNKGSLVEYNIEKDLYINNINKNIKNINCHLNMKPLKSIIKKICVPLKKSNNIKFFLAAKEPNKNNIKENKSNENNNLQDMVIKDFFKKDGKENIFQVGNCKRRLKIDDLTSNINEGREKEISSSFNNKQSNIINKNSDKKFSPKIYLKNKDNVNVSNSTDVKLNNFFNDLNKNSIHQRLNSASKKQEQEKFSIPNIINLNNVFNNHQNKILLRSLVNNSPDIKKKYINFNLNNHYNNIFLVKNKNNQNRNKNNDSFDKNNKGPSFDLIKNKNQSSKIYNNRYEQNNIGPVKLYKSDDLKKFKSEEKSKRKNFKYDYINNLSASIKIHKSNSMHQWKKPNSAQQKIMPFKNKIIKKMNGNILSKSNGFSYKQMSASFFPNIDKDLFMNFGIGDNLKRSFENYRSSSSSAVNNKNWNMNYKKK